MWQQLALLAAFALNLLPTRYSALVLILVAFGLFALEGGQESAAPVIASTSGKRARGSKSWRRSRTASTSARCDRA